MEVIDKENTKEAKVENEKKPEKVTSKKSEKKPAKVSDKKPVKVVTKKTDETAPVKAKEEKVSDKKSVKKASEKATKKPAIKKDDNPSESKSKTKTGTVKDMQEKVISKKPEKKNANKPVKATTKAETPSKEKTQTETIKQAAKVTSKKTEEIVQVEKAKNKTTTKKATRTPAIKAAKIKSDKAVEKTSKDEETEEEIEYITEKYSETYRVVPSERRSKKTLLMSMILIVVLLNLVLLFTGFALANINNTGIVAGITVNGIDLEGLTRQEAIDILEEMINLDREIIIKADELESSFMPSQIMARYNIEEIVEKAYGIGREGNIFRNNFDIMRANIFNIEFELVLLYDEVLLEEAIRDIAIRLPDPVLEPHHYIERDRLIITRGIMGNSIDAEETRTLILNEIRNNTGEDIELEVIILEPGEIDIVQIYNDIFREAQDAYFVEEPFQVFTHVYGVRFDVEEAKLMLEEYQEQYIIELIITTPSVTINRLGERAFPDTLSSFSTRFDPGNVSRTTNIQLVTERMNEVVVMPGEIFSFNQTVGRRTAAAGFREAPRICRRKSSANARRRDMSAFIYPI